MRVQVSAAQAVFAADSGLSVAKIWGNANLSFWSRAGCLLARGVMLGSHTNTLLNPFSARAALSHLPDHFCPSVPARAFLNPRS